jgi:MoxR-like ATPase
MSHRMIVSADAAMSGRTTREILAELLHEVPVPVRDRT